MRRRYDIPSDYPASDFTWAEEGPLANWTSYPLYSYQTYTRSNPAPSSPEAQERRRLLGKAESKRAQANELIEASYQRAGELPTFVAVGMREEAERLLIEASDLERAASRLAKTNPKLGPDPFEGIAQPYRQPTAGGPYLPQIFPYGQGGRPATYAPAKANPRGSRGGYAAGEREALPSGAFLKPQTRSWPVSDRRHAEIALQYMLRRFGRPAEYPELVRSLAKLYPVSDPKNKPIWSMYASYRDRISASAGETMPSLDELRRVQPRSRKNPRAPKDALWVAEYYRNAPPIRSYEAYCEIRNAADCGKHPEVAYYLSYGTRELKEKESKDPMAKWELDYRTARGGGRNGFQIGKKKKR